MKLILDSGKQIELDKAQSLGEGDIIIKSKVHMHPKDIDAREQELSKKLERKVVILNAEFDDIYILPP